MAKITCNFDTEVGEVEVKIDGTLMQNVEEFSVYTMDINYGGEDKEVFCVRIGANEDDAANVEKRTSVTYVSKAADTENLGVKCSYEGLVKLTESSIDKQVSEYFG